MSEGKCPESANRQTTTERYEVQFQRNCERHSYMDDLEQAKYYARSLANWNLAAQVYDRLTQSIVFRARAYAYAKKRRHVRI